MTIRLPFLKPIIAAAILLGALRLPSLAQSSPPQPSVEFATDTHGAVTVPAKDGINIQVKLNGQGPVDALFDSGSGALMSLGLAKRLGLKLEGSGSLVGFGAGSMPVQGAMVDRLEIGGLTLRNVLFFVVDSEGTDESLAIGTPLLLNTVVKVNFDRQQISFCDPSSFRPSASAASVAIQNRDNNVLAEASIDGIPGLFGIDTGDSHSIEILHPFVVKHRLVKRYEATVQGYTGSGFGGPDTGFFTRAGTLQLGSLRVKRPVTVLSQDTQGFGAAEYAGNIGIHVLRRFTLTFDCGHGKLYLEKSARYGVFDPFNRAGMVLDPTFEEPGSNSEDNSLMVKTVFPHSPAEKAGIGVGDEIVTLGNRKPEEDNWESYFVQPVGTRIELTVRHGATIRPVTLVLKDVL